jgi:polyphosphate kinase 2 (PPK2 family)
MSAAVDPPIDAQVPGLENALVGNGVHLAKRWFSVSGRATHPLRRAGYRPAAAAVT